MGSKNPLLEIAKIGKRVGVYGTLKFHITSDFPQQFKKNKTYTTKDGIELKIKEFDLKRMEVVFYGYEDRESSAILTNKIIVSTIEESKKNCQLKKGEFFWFELVGAEVLEKEFDGKDGIEKILKLGMVEDIDRIGVVDYLIVKTTDELVNKKYSKTFMIPYIEKYIDIFDADKKIVFTKNSFGLLEAS